MVITGILITIVILFGFYYTNLPLFGKAPSGERLERIKKSPQYKNGKFENIHFTPTLTKGYSFMGILYNQFFKRVPNKTPKIEIPSIKTNLKEFNTNENIVVWFGHSSYFMQIDGKKFLIDPVFSGNASPIPNSIKAFKGSNDYQVADLPEIDFLIISHDHYDHLDYKTIIELKGKVKKIICGLGVGSHFEYWGYSPAIIIEKDWYETEILSDTITIHTTPARHFSGRGLTRNNTLWLSFVLQTSESKIFIGGDSGYDSHFSEIGKEHGPFDLAILENGQYNLAWEAIHLLPEHFIKAASELNAKRIFPVHSSKFALAQHNWDEPLSIVSDHHKKGNFNYTLITPKIGEAVLLDTPNQLFSEWWKS